jgi:DNA polymerase I-like protein with 3'-5' exonuclease and polymerase domains
MVITTQAELEYLTNRLRGETTYVYPVAVDAFLHSSQNRVALLQFLFDDGTSYTVSVNHPDAPHFQMDLSDAYKLVTLHKKELQQLTNAKNVVDLASLIHLNGDVIPLYREYYTMAMHQIKSQFKFKNLHYSIPLTSWIETAEAFLQHCKHMYDRCQSTEQTSAFEFINQITIPTLTKIEQAGLWTTDNQFVYSDYNIYTSTGRPSNAFGGINFAALNKNDGTREKFVSRFGENGTLVQFDYEAFHLRLAADLIGYKLPESSVHEFLAKQYYGTDNITEEQYEESKSRTFGLMYGYSDDTGGVEFFQKLKEYSSDLWEKYRQNGFVLSGTGRKVTVFDPTSNKVFNYMMQLTETEEAIARVNGVCQYLDMFKSKVILYTYDAILLDVHNDELDIMGNVAEKLSKGGYPVRQYRGHNYNQISLYKI